MSIFKGRTNRAWFGLILGVLVLLYIAINALSEKPLSMSEVVLIILAVPRLHDIGKSGKFVLIGIAVEIVGVALMLLSPSEAMGGIAALTSLTLLGLMIWLAFIPGEPGPNQWGEAPEPGFTRKGFTHPDM